MARAEEILRERLIDEDGNLVEIIIWHVKPSLKQPDGIRYRLAFIRAADEEPTVLYDNHHPKGHHRHLQGVEQPYDFTDVQQLIDDFQADVKRLPKRKK